MSFSSAVNTKKEFWVDIRDFFAAYEEPSFENFALATRLLYPEDPTVVIRPMKGPLEGIYKIISKSDPKRNVITLDRVDRASGVKEEVTIPLSTSSPAQKSQKDDLLVTIVDSNMGSASEIAGSVFDTAFAAIGRVVAPSRAQRFNKTSILNGNRFIIMDKSAKIPDRLDIEGHSFLLKYRGKKWYCSSCLEDHVGPCAYLQRFHELKARKEKEDIKINVVGDSSLRLIEHVGILADVVSMSGASAGQLVTVAENDPKFSQHSEVVLAAGANDTRSSSVIDENFALKKIDLSLKRVEQMVIKEPDRTFHFFDSTPQVEQLSPQDSLIQMYFQRTLDKIERRNENFGLLSIGPYMDCWEDGHPTENGTCLLIRAIEEKCPDLVQDPSFTTTTKPYRGVDTLFLRGCSGCRARGRFVSGGFCSQCIERIDSANVADLDLLQEIKDELDSMFPNDRKRAREPNTSSDDNDVSKKIVL